MKLTTNFKLKKPDYSDSVDIQDINDNMDIIDSEISVIGDLSSLTTTEKTSLVGAISEVKDRTNLATTTTDGLMSGTDKTKLNGIGIGAQKNTITSVNGQTGEVIVPDTTYDVATTSENGLMSSAMWTKLNGLYNMVYLSESAFTALATKDPNTLYLRY